MKKFLGFMVMSLVAVLPFTVDAASQMGVTCGDFNAEGIRECTVWYDIEESNPQSDVIVLLTEVGGAEVQSITNSTGSEFQVASQSEKDNVHSVVAMTNTLSTTTGKHNLLTFTYKQSGTEDCKITVSIGESKTDAGVNETPDKPADNVQTGSTLPYIALGGILLVAAAAFVTTRKKSKMYNI